MGTASTVEVRAMPDGAGRSLENVGYDCPLFVPLATEPFRHRFPKTKEA